MVASNTDRVSGRNSSKIRGMHVFMHPLLRISAGVEGTPQQFRSFHRLVRRALEAPDFSKEKTILAVEVLEALNELGIDDESASSFRQEWLEKLTRSVESPTVHELRALDELDQAGLALRRDAWRARLPLPESCSFLRLDSLHPKPDDSDRPLRMPTSTAASLLSCVNLAVCAHRDDELHTWNSSDCLAVLRSIAMLSVLETERMGLREPLDRKEYFIGIGQGLWAAVAKQLASLPDAEDHECFCDGSLQKLVALHVSGRAFVETTVVASLPDAPIESSPTGCSGSAGSTHAGVLKVVHGPIPTASHKEDVETLRIYRPLLMPQPIAAMPTIAEVDGVLEALSREFPWAGNVVSELGGLMRARCLFGVRELCLSPVLIVGRPGAGKSRFVRRLAEHLKLPFLPLALGGRSDSKLLSGTSRGWAGGEPTPLLRFMLQHKTASGLVLLDEIDKIAATDSTSPPATSMLLGLLEPETASRWHDGFLQTTCDFTRLSFWATANSLKQMPAPLLSRFTVLYMSEPEPEHLEALVEGITNDIAKEWRMPEGVLPLAPRSLYEGARLNARELRRMIMRFLNDWAHEYRRPERLH